MENNVDNNLVNHPYVTSYLLGVKIQFSLTDRELVVLQQLAFYGASNRSIGEVLGMSEKTAKNHMNNIKNKFDVRSCRMLQAILFRDVMTVLSDHKSR